MSDPPKAPSVPSPWKKVQLEKVISMDKDIESTTNSRRSSKLKTSMILTRWLASSSKNDEQQADWISDEQSVEFGTPPPIEEPHCYSMCATESSYAEETDGALRVTKELVKNIIVEHMKYVRGRVQLLEDLETGRLNVQDTEHMRKTCKPVEINVLLLCACYLARAEIVSGLHKCGADLNHEEHGQGLTALHFAAFSNSLEIVRYLMVNGANININQNQSHTAFHYAAFGNAVDVARHFLQQGLSQESPSGEESVLHAAARSNALSVLQLLAPKNPALNELDCNGYAAIHHVADKGSPACLTVLLEAGCELDLMTRKGDTGLHLAAESSCVENVDQLVEKGANVHLKNHRGHTALHIASRAHCLQCVAVLLRKGASDPNTEDNDGRTALHLALGKSLLANDVTEFLITWRADVNKTDKYGYTPLHVAALNELSECVDLLIQHGADLSAKTQGGTTALSIILRKTPTSLNVFKQRLDGSISLQQHGSAAGEVELRIDFHPLLLHQQQGEVGYLGTFVKEGYKEILEHPLCQSFLYLKWQKIKKYYYGRLLFYLSYVLLLTSWVITALAHNCYNESHGIVNEGRPPFCPNSTAINSFFHRHPGALDIECYALITFTVLEAVRKLTGIPTYLTMRQFFSQAENMVEWCVITSVFATSFIYTGRTYAWQSHVGAFAVLCGWSNLMLMIGQLPIFGAYVAMFTSVQAQVFKLLLAYACLLVGFTASFCVIFPRSKAFSSPHIGLIKVLVMMTGELNFEDLFFPREEDGRSESGSTSWILLQVSAQLSFVLFLLFVTIVLMNLLVGIAVHDIKGLQKTAGLAKLVRQTKLICDLETALFLSLMPRHVTKFLHWTTLVLPSPMRAVLTVRPLNPRETRLPRDILAAAHKVAKDRKNLLTTLSSRKSTAAYTFLRCDPYTKKCERIPEESAPTECKNVKDEMADLRRICERNHKLIQDLVVVLSTDRSRYPSDSDEESQ